MGEVKNYKLEAILCNYTHRTTILEARVRLLESRMITQQLLRKERIDRLNNKIIFLSSFFLTLIILLLFGILVLLISCLFDRIILKSIGDNRFINETNDSIVNITNYQYY